MPHSSSLYRFQTTFEPYSTAPVTAPRRGLQFLSATARPIFAIGDGSKAALNAAWRAALIGQSWGAPVHLLNAQLSASRASADQRHPENSALEDAGLLVTHVEDGCRPFEWLLGTCMERLVRTYSIPILVVKQPANRRYRRALVGVKLDPQASELVASARMLAPRAHVDVVHVLRTSHEYKLRLADAPEAVVRAHRTRTQRDAYRMMNDLIAAACGHEANAITPRLVVGSAPDRLLEMGRAARAGFVVLGKRRRHWLGDLFLDRGVARRVLAESPSDVLLVPTRG